MKNRSMSKSGPKKPMRKGGSGPKTKTRKELRKDKRQQKKINRFNWHSKKKSDQIKERQQQKKSGPEESAEDSDEDEEIPSDFEDGDEEAVVSSTTTNISQLERDRQKELKELRSYEESLKSKRIDQLKAANEEDDLVIRKYEKLLNINRRKNKDGIAKSFDDGLDYALELCTPENIQKMYDAAKEADNLFENGSEDEFKEDLDTVIGNSSEKTEKLSKSEKAANRKKIEKLKNVEKKYFGNDLDSLDGFDSEMDDIIEEDEDFDSYNEDDEEGPFKNEKKVKFEENSDEDDEFDIEEDMAEDYSDSGNENEIMKDIVTSKNKKNGKKESKKSKNNEKKSKGKNIENEDYDSDEAAVFEKLAALKRKNNKSDDGKMSKKQKVQEPSDESLDSDEAGVFKKLAELKGKKNKNDTKMKKDKKLKKNIEKDNSDSDEAKVFQKLAELERNRNANKKSKKGKSEDKIQENYDSDEAEVFKNLAKQKNAKKSEIENSDNTEDDFDEDLEDDMDLEDEDEDEASVFEKLAALKNKKNKTEKKSGAEWEDIYGRKRDKDGNVVTGTSGVYVPPHLRAKQNQNSDDSKKSEKLLRLKKLLKGHINRLSEANLHKIFNEIDNLYMQNARFDMNTTVNELILEVLVSNTLSPERMVLEHVLLVAVLHANVGLEVGARFLETVIGKFIGLIGNIKEMAVEDKELDNLVFILCHMYTFQIFKHKLIYDILYKMIDCFNEKSVECILLILKSIGFLLRKDDPLILKDLIIAVQKKANESTEELKNDSRVKFMLDILLAVKNNNMNKIPQYDPTLVEHFRKLLKGMITSGKYISSLNISLDDITKADERGKWWLVGSAWVGNNENQRNKLEPGSEGTFSQKLLELAKKQRMNTDDRKNVFCIIMSAEDYIDAFSKILGLSIKDQKIIVSVILHCMLAEKESNPYYNILAQKFCDHDRKYQLAFQFALWDKFKELNALNSNQIRNLAKFVNHLIGQGGLPLSVLKVIEFAELDKTSLRLVRQIMIGLLLEKDDVFQQVFNRVSPSLKLKGFKDSLRLFLHHFLLKSSGKGNIPEEQLELLKQRIKNVDKCFENV